MGRFEKISTGGGTAFQYYYNAASNETQRHNYLSNPELDQFYGRDSLNRMSARYARQTNGPTFSAEFYTYDRMSRLIEVARAEGGKSDLFWYYWDGNMLGAQYGVDTDMPDTTDPWSGWTGDPEAEGVEPPPLDEGEPPPAVVEEPAVAIDRWVSYFLDNAGNRTRVVDTGVHKLYTPNNFNQYTQAEGVGVGNGTEHEVSSFQGNNYTYRNDERLIGVTSPGNTYSLAYDALGRCVKRTLNGVTTYYIYDGEKPIVEYSAGAIVGRNVYGKWIDEILMRTDPTVNGGQPFYYHQDRNHNVTHLTNASGNVIEKYKYDAFGAPTIYAPDWTERSTSLYRNRFLFTDREYAATFGFYEYRARAYNPTLDRFMSEDPIGFQIAGEKPSPTASLMFPTQLPKTFEDSEFNLFRYCHNDPVNKTDPDGLYGRGTGFTDKEWEKFDRAQQAAAGRLEKASELMRVSTFEKVFGKGSATAENMGKVAKTMQAMAKALRDDGTKGYKANAMSESSRTLGRGTVGGKQIWMNTAHPAFGNRSALTSAAGHEAGHNSGLGHGSVNGVTAYRNGDAAQRDAYKNLPSAGRLGTRIIYMEFAE